MIQHSREHTTAPFPPQTEFLALSEASKNVSHHAQLSEQQQFLIADAAQAFVSSLHALRVYFYRTASKFE
jgi:hypothetical protein